MENAIIFFEFRPALALISFLFLTAYILIFFCLYFLFVIYTHTHTLTRKRKLDVVDFLTIIQDMKLEYNTSRSQ